MPIAVKGYQISDGRFFKNVEEANYEENKLILQDLGRIAIQITQQNLPAFLDFLEAHPREVIDYCTSYEALSAKVDSDFYADELAAMREGVEVNAPNQKPSKTKD